MGQGATNAQEPQAPQAFLREERTGSGSRQSERLVTELALDLFAQLLLHWRTEVRWLLPFAWPRMSGGGRSCQAEVPPVTVLAIHVWKRAVLHSGDP
eukprot:scaffold7785_cov27-Tisochrysis_lutea.AAC.5